MNRALVGAVAVALFAWDVWLERRGPTDRQRRLRSRLFAAMGAIAFAAWWNFGLFHLDHWTHLWDVFHYEVGAKYSPELGYTRLYTCAAVAEVELGHGAEVGRRSIRDLETNRVLPGSALTATNSAGCRARFTRARWEEFVHDVGWYRDRITPERWNGLFQDHGFNPTPAWGILGRLFASYGPSSEGKLLLLTLLDPLLTGLLWVVSIRTFGMGAASVGLVWWGLNSVAEFGWIGGSFLRTDWLCLCVLGVALLKAERPFAAGVILTCASLLRIFPAFFAFGIVLKAAAEIAASRRIRLSREHVRFAGGCLAALAVIVPLSGLVASGGRSVFGPWPAFVSNSQKHVATPSMNNMGLRTVLSWTPEAPLVLGATDDPVTVWWARHEEAFTGRRPLFVAVVLAAGLLAARGARREENWVAACLGALLIPFVTVLSCYYYGFLLVLGFLWLRKRTLGVAVALLATLSSVAALAARWPYDNYVLQSLAVLIVAGGTLVSFAAGSPAPRPRGG